VANLTLQHFIHLLIHRILRTQILNRDSVFLADSVDAVFGLLHLAGDLKDVIVVRLVEGFKVGT
jgi:hypothetical protein